MDRATFRRVLQKSFGMTADTMMDRVFQAVARDGSNSVSEESWVLGMNIFLRGTRDEQVKYAHAIYDLNGDHYIERGEMFQLLKNTMVKHQSEEDREESIKDLVDLVLKKMTSCLSESIAPSCQSANSSWRNSTRPLYSVGWRSFWNHEETPIGLGEDRR